ncbi:MAG: peptide chain release factor 3, partial [Actinomycetota bacterium]|nr:peptide chain release factor 3 [Actinomycetota bacterium]
AEQRVALAAADRGECPPDRWDAAMEELELLDLEGAELDPEAFLAGKQTPVFFGSAIANFGVRLLLEGFAQLAPAPGPQVTVDPPGTRAVDSPFSAQVFKIQANMDPRHRDRVAFLRVCSGRFERGMAAVQARTGRSYTLKYAHQLFARDRTTMDQAVPGDIVGVVNANGLLVGDTLYAGPKVEFPLIPTFAPERFVTVRNRDTGRYKQFRSGIARLDEEGVVHLLRRPDFGDQEPLFAGVGQLQFEVAAYRLATEFGCQVLITPAPWQLARRVTAAEASRLRGQRGTLVCYDTQDRWLLLLASDYALDWATQDHPDIDFQPLGVSAAR